MRVQTARRKQASVPGRQKAARLFTCAQGSSESAPAEEAPGFSLAPLLAPTGRPPFPARLICTGPRRPVGPPRLLARKRRNSPRLRRPRFWGASPNHLGRRTGQDAPGGAQPGPSRPSQPAGDQQDPPVAALTVCALSGLPSRSPARSPTEGMATSSFIVPPPGRSSAAACAPGAHSSPAPTAPPHSSPLRPPRLAAALCWASPASKIAPAAAAEQRHFARSRLTAFLRAWRHAAACL